MKRFHRASVRLAGILFVAAVLAGACNGKSTITGPPIATNPNPTSPAFGSAQTFAVLGASAVTNTGGTAITGDLGVSSPGISPTGFPPGKVTGTIHAGDAAAVQAHNDLTPLYNTLAAKTCNTPLTGLDLGSRILTQGVYCFTSSAQLTGTLKLVGNAQSVFIFQIASSLNTATKSAVVMSGGSSARNVYWQVGSSASLGTGTAFKGNIIALTSISLATGASLSGRALARNGAVTMDTNAITKP
jgi:type VI secretion system secreted protein VgrG